LHRNIQQFTEARQMHEEALQIRRELAKSDPQAYLPDVAILSTTWAICSVMLNSSRKQSRCTKRLWIFTKY
jgi:hypothetical protein